MVLQMAKGSFLERDLLMSYSVGQLYSEVNDWIIEQKNKQNKDLDS
jgi:hypothetical protein